MLLLVSLKVGEGLLEALVLSPFLLEDPCERTKLLAARHESPLALLEVPPKLLNLLLVLSPLLALLLVQVRELRDQFTLQQGHLALEAGAELEDGAGESTGGLRLGALGA